MLLGKTRCRSGGSTLHGAISRPIAHKLAVAGRRAQ
jgi:hypothetical protein